LINKKPYIIAIWILTVFTIILIGREISFIFSPLVVIFRILFLPIMFAVILYYLLTPLVDWLEGHKIPRAFAIIIIFAAIMIVGFILFAALGILAYQQLIDLAENLPDYIKNIEIAIASMDEHWLLQRLQANGILSFSEMAGLISENLLNALSELSIGFSAAVSLLTNAFIALVLLPLILFYMLKDGEAIRKYTKKHIPKNHKEEAEGLLKEIDKGLSLFIQGQIVVSISVGILMFIGFLIVGLKYSLVFALFAMLTNFIPYLGPIISTIPAVIIGFATSPATGFQVMLVIIIVQQIESFLITPQVMGKKLDLHPLMVIIGLILIGSLAGFVGLILAIPILIVLKIIATHLFYLLKVNASMKR
jgi:predicted PurR-regulated permease PerM